MGRMWLVAVAAVVSGGCSLLFAPDDPSGGDIDASVADGSTVVDGRVLPDGALCGPWDVEPLNHDPCGQSQRDPIDLVGMNTYDSESGELSGPRGAISSPPRRMVMIDGIDVVIVMAGGILIEDGAVLQLVGRHPVIFSSSGDVFIAGAIDASSRDDIGKPGAGANPADCASIGGENATAAGNGGGGGAGGGGFNTPGDGGIGVDGADGGMGSAVIISGAIHGGCRGGNGGSGMNGGALATANGGRGGGAFQISAATRIMMTSSAVLAAGGEGGKGGADDTGGGGGGGGSGGLIILDAPQIQVSGRVYATAGGGGEGATGASAGGDGGPGVSTSFSLLGTGGAGGGEGGDGGDGGDGSPGESGQPGVVKGGGGTGGGGGGGGSGRIEFRDIDLNDNTADVVPPATPIQ